MALGVSLVALGLVALVGQSFAREHCKCVSLLPISLLSFVNILLRVGTE